MKKLVKFTVFKSKFCAMIDIDSKSDTASMMEAQSKLLDSVKIESVEEPVDKRGKYYTIPYQQVLQ